MSDEASPEDSPAKPGLRRAILFGLPLAVLGAGSGFYAAYSGLLPFGGRADNLISGQNPAGSDAAVAFVPLDPMIVSVGQSGQGRHLRFQAQLEVNPASVEVVTNLLPRVVDVLNGYLRAVELSFLEDPAVLIRMRSQLLRRIQIVTGDGHVRDVLIMEFVLS